MSKSSSPIVELIPTPWENKFMKLVSEARSSIIIVCPFIKFNIIESILNHRRKNVEIKLLTKSDINDMSKGVFDFKIWDLIFNHKNVEIRTIKNLHAKMFIFDENQAVISSSNLTNAGLNHNIEYGVKISDSNFIQSEIIPSYLLLWEQGKEISINDVKLIESELEKTDLSQIVFLDKKTASSLGITTLGLYVSPVGNDIEYEELLSSQNVSIRIFTNLLMRIDLEKKIVESLRLKYLDSEKWGMLTVNGLSFAFDSDNPFITAGFYYNNVLKINPSIKKHLLRGLPNMFKNMIFNTGKTNIIIRNSREYYQIKQNFVNNLTDLKPPPKDHVFQVIINDKKCMNIIMRNPLYFLRIRNIFDYKKTELLDLKNSIIEFNSDRIQYFKNRILKDDLSHEDKTKFEKTIEKTQNYLDLLAEIKK